MNLPTKEKLYIDLDKTDRKKAKEFIESHGYKTYHNMNLWNLWESKNHRYVFLDFALHDLYYRYTFGESTNEHWKEITID